MLLVRNSQFLATLSTTLCQYTTTIGSSHSLTETVLVVTATVVRLESSLHNNIIFIYLFDTKHFGVQNYRLLFKYTNILGIFVVREHIFQLKVVTLHPQKHIVTQQKEQKKPYDQLTRHQERRMYPHGRQALFLHRLPPPQAR